MTSTKEAEKTLITGNLWRAIWVMSWPLVLTTVANSMVGLADVQVAGYLGAATQAAVGLAEHVLFIFMLAIMSIGVGTTALVSRAFGAGEEEEMYEAAAQSISLSILFGLGMAIIAVFTAHFALGSFSQSQEVLEKGRDYLSCYSLVLIPFSFTIIANAAFRAIGDSKTPLYIVSCMTAVNVAGDYLTVMHDWPVPGLGVRGIAYAGLAASILGSCLAIFFFNRSSLKPALKKLLPFNKAMLGRISKIGVPSALQRLSWSLSVFVIFLILARCPDATHALASWTIGMRIESLIFMPLMALSLSVSSIVGQNLGAKEVERAYKAGWRVTSIGIYTMIAAGIIMYVCAPAIAGVMTREPQALAYTIDYLRINAIGEPFLALAMVLAGALQGAGDTRTPMYLSIMTNWVVRIPLGYFMAIQLKLGVDGIWWAMTTSIFLQGLLMAMRFKSRKWITEKI